MTTDGIDIGMLIGMSTQIAIRLPDELLAAVDALVARGDAESRADAVRAALERHISAIERDRTDDAIRSGYERRPAVLDNVDAAAAWADRSTTELLRELDRQERAAGFDRW